MSQFFFCSVTVLTGAKRRIFIFLFFFTQEVRNPVWVSGNFLFTFFSLKSPSLPYAAPRPAPAPTRLCARPAAWAARSEFLSSASARDRRRRCSREVLLDC